MNPSPEQKIADLLRALADQIEKNPDLLRPKPMSGRTKPKINLFDLAAKGGDLLLQKELERLDTAELKQVIREHSFDSSRLAGKWKNRQRLIDLIIRRTMALNSKGNVFL